MLPDGLTSVSRALFCARLSGAAYEAGDARLRELVAAQGHTVDTIFRDADTDIGGFLSYNPTTKAMALAFRGTILTSLTNWNTNFYQELGTLSEDLGSAIQVVSGFRIAYEKIHAAVQQAVERKVAEVGGPSTLKAFYFTGHSLGGALATYAGLLMAILLKQKYDFANSDVLQVLVLAAPPTGNHNFARYYRSMDHLFRSTNYATTNDSVATGLWTVAPGVQFNFRDQGYSGGCPTFVLASTVGFPNAHFLSSYISALSDTAWPVGLQSLRVDVTTGSGASMPWSLLDSPGTTRRVTFAIGGLPGEFQLEQELRDDNSVKLDIATHEDFIPFPPQTVFLPGVLSFQIRGSQMFNRAMLKRWKVSIGSTSGWFGDIWDLAGLKIIADGHVIYDDQLINTLLGTEGCMSVERAIPPAQ
jgi:hypothetical protein